MSSNKKKVAILTPTFSHHSGIDRVVEQQAEEYSKNGDDVTVIALEAKIISKKYKIIELGMPKNGILQRLYRLFFFLDRKNLNYYKNLKDFDMIISHFYPMNWIAYEAKKYYGKKYVYFDHGINTTGLLDSIMQKIYMKIFLLFSNYTLRNVDETFSVSKYLSKVLYKESRIKSKVEYNKINKKRFNKNVKPENIIKKYDLKGRKVFLYVGRIAPHKGIHLLIKSFNLAKKSMPNSKLLLVGKPTFPRYYEKLKKRVDKGVIFTGFVEDEDLPRYYAACDVYVTCSQWEGFNLPAAEAQACEKPVVAFNIGSHPEIVKNGKLVEKSDLEAFSKAMLKYANSA
ncbi:glycosyltransferase family 4 protein [Candidatus Woesearchaeota archaeon]|nr:glycosyltransferase family 4 protein [Candidatus Woesearchaeota archaeon]